MPMATTFGSFVAFPYSWSSVYSRSLGISAMATVELGSNDLSCGTRTVTERTSRAKRAGSERCRVLSRFRVLHQVGPYVVDAALQLRERAGIVDDEIRAGALELGRHLRGDHVHRLGFAEAPIV